ncbi:UNVERIFIED_ORG: Rieske 2Fe-2S family protein [Pseudomonas lini]
MQDVTKPAISQLLNQRTAFKSLPAPLYIDQEVFQAELEVFFHHHWICVGVTADVPEAGDALVLDIGKTSLILLRDDDDKISVVHNVCRHRGARLLESGHSIISKLVCPYHQWTYELSGELVHAPHMGKDFDKSCHGLKRVNFRTIAGLIYVCLANDPPEDIDDLQETLEHRLAPYNMLDVRIAHEQDFIEEGNWKLTIENNRECYHCSASHPELTVTAIGAQFGFDPASLSEEDRQAFALTEAESQAQTTAWEAAGYPSVAIEHLAGNATNFRTERLVLSNGAESHTLDGKVACRRLLGNLSEKGLGDIHLWGHNSWHHFFSDHAVISIVIPLSANRTLVRTKWLVRKDAVEGLDYDLEALTRVWIETTRQDAELVGKAHAGIQDPAYEPGPYSSFTEGQLENFAIWYTERMRANGY